MTTQTISLPVNKIPFFFNHVDKTSNCWLWTGSLRKGYGAFYNMAAHRVAYYLYKGQLDTSLEIDHLCRVRNCVNPEHLEQVEKSINLRRRPLKEYCGKGHVFTEVNTYIRPDRNVRECKDCHNIASQKYRLNKKEK
jgi:hypothetical protein